MSLRDQSCYTLILQTSASDPSIVELVHVEGLKREARYARVKEPRPEGGEVYSAVLYDYYNGAKLASAGYGAEKGSKQRRLQLHGPDEDVPFDLTGKMSFEWTFVFGGNKFRWTREIYGKDYICSLDRKPDPKVEICLARSADKTDPARIQILHYNLERFPNEITDLRGLETLLVTTFMTFVDASDDRASRPAAPPRLSPSLPEAAGSSALGQASGKPHTPEKAISADDFEPESENEIRVRPQSDLDERIARAVGLLMDPSVLFVIIKTSEPAVAQKALQVALGVTRFRHREGLADLHQYVVEQKESAPIVPPPGKGPKVIKLDDPVTPASPPKRPSVPATALNIAIYLSTIQLPDLVPKVKPAVSASGHTPAPPSKGSPRPSASSKPVASGPPKAPVVPTPPVSAPAAVKTAPVKAAVAPPPPRPAPAPIVPAQLPPPPHLPSRPLAPLSHPSPGIEPPRPPPPSAPDGKAKSESVVKKLIAMSRR